MAFRKLPARAAAFAHPFVISVLMSCIVSGISTYRNLGPDADFPSMWMSAWAISWIVAFPLLLVVLPTARRIVFLFVEKPNGA